MRLGSLGDVRNIFHYPITFFLVLCCLLVTALSTTKSLPITSLSFSPYHIGATLQVHRLLSSFFVHPSLLSTILYSILLSSLTVPMEKALGSKLLGLLLLTSLCISGVHYGLGEIFFTGFGQTVPSLYFPKAFLEPSWGCGSVCLALAVLGAQTIDDFLCPTLWLAPLSLIHFLLIFALRTIFPTNVWDDLSGFLVGMSLALPFAIQKRFRRRSVDNEMV
eukprot:gnl/Trimastix_PCT/4570.p1 GENE.gnl/Trimastix_PCT/4570~~gnl/Trimastix_PCT/4570.p1  ORF type:complete len:220 (+),score=18.79 gnl/Trimastix_PCT/4570:31-690(+)